MASKIFNMIFFSLLISSFAIIQMATAGDADIPSDFIIPQNVTTVDGNFFTFIGLRSIVGSNPPPTFKASKASLVEFPALNGHSVSYAVLQFPAGTTNPPHIHPRSAELLFLVDGTLQVGFVDTTNKLFNQTLQTGDPNFQHLQYNADANNSALAISAFGSANAGTISIPNTLFTTGIDDTILAKSFKTNVATIQALKAVDDGLSSRVVLRLKLEGCELSNLRLTFFLFTSSVVQSPHLNGDLNVISGFLES
ncbi:hypothetical protein I3760_01G256400 [Carya illinoinensis]|nr:hypothetical protein I3760_01G256400 [Carya illinoinensis]